MQYLNQLLEDQRIPENFEKEMENDRDKIEKVIYSISELPRPTIYYGGSHGKKTLIKESYDLDLVLYYPSETKTSVKEIYNIVRNQLKEERDDTIKKNVAIRLLKREKYHIDVIPGKRISNNEDFAYIYKSKQDVSLKTSVKRHIESVKEFARRDILKLLKLWKVRNSLDIPSFLLEQIAMSALPNIRSDIALDAALVNVLECISSKLPTIRITDPANSNNVITDEDVISTGDKKIVANAAEWALTNDLKTVEGWANVFRKKTQSPSSASSESQRAPRLAPDSPARRFG